MKTTLFCFMSPRNDGAALAHNWAVHMHSPNVYTKIVWNCLPNWVVSADTTNNFKTRLDKHWHNQDIIYDFTAQLHGIGSRSESLN